MGATGAGKSTLAEKKWLRFAPKTPSERGWKHQPRETAPSRRERKGPAKYFHVVNPDDFKEEIRGFDPDAPHKVHEISVDMADTYFDGVIETGEPLIVDGTGAAIKRMTLNMTLAKEAGYHISLVYVYVPLLVAFARNLARSRSVPPRVVVNSWFLGKKNFPQIKNLADKVTVIDSTAETDKALIQKLLPLIDKEAKGGYGMGIRDLLEEYDPTSLKRYEKQLNVLFMDSKKQIQKQPQKPAAPKTVVRQKPIQQSLF